jgi:hypothetical protein
MPAAAYNVGRDVTLTIFNSDGVIATDGLKDFTSKRRTTKINQVLLTGEMRPASLPEGWDLSFTFSRQDSSIDDYFAALEANYYAGKDLPTGTITETITNPDGSISEYQYQNIALDFEEAGSWAGNKEVDQKVTATCGRRVKTA